MWLSPYGEGHERSLMRIQAGDSTASVGGVQGAIREFPSLSAVKHMLAIVRRFVPEARRTRTLFETQASRMSQLHF